VTGQDAQDGLAGRFEAHRSHLRAVAYRMLGSATDAEDAVQEAWLRTSRADTSGVDNLGGWLTTVVARICLDILRSRHSRREEPLESTQPDPAVTATRDAGPERDALLADSIGVALLVVLETLSPAERVAFVLHDMFDLSFDEIAPIVGRSAMATRQLASRARRRVQGARTSQEADRARRRELVDAFLAAARSGDVAALLAVLDPDVVVRADDAAVQMGAVAEQRGAASVALTYSRRARGAQRALVDSMAGLVWAPGGLPRVVFDFTIEGGKIVAIDLVADPPRLARYHLVILSD
jgi:RNA polymerase sigma-70 factor (ECF subfamily)